MGEHVRYIGPDDDDLQEECPTLTIKAELSVDRRNGQARWFIRRVEGMPKQMSAQVRSTVGSAREVHVEGAEFLRQLGRFVEELSEPF